MTSGTFDPKEYSIAQTTPLHLTGESYWNMHIPFAFALTQMLRPRLFVELGTHRGESYLAFCQAVEALGLDARCYAVDSWAGDIHTGQYEEKIYQDLKSYHDPRYSRFSTLLKSLFDDARDRFEDGSIDLLHIDGTHTYEAVKHDFDSWLPKMSERGVVIMHDVAEYREEFGVWRLWDELKARYPYFEFPFGHGLGVVAVGAEAPEPVMSFLGDEDHAPATAHYFSMLGERVEGMAKARDKGTNVGPADTQVSRSAETVPGEGPDVAQQSPRLLAFYLPQFHPIPENDLWWGKGFTEWTNVARARPLFPGHRQPHLPADLGFYDLRLPEVRSAQAALAAEHGISGFCYYHYWFKGRRLLERPLDEMLATGEPDFPFCLCWANASWTMHWHGGKADRLIEQEYSEEDDREHIRWLLGIFEDERYIRVNGRPLLLIYRAPDLPDPLRTVTMWKAEANRAGVAEPYVCKVETAGNSTDPRTMGCDAAVEFPPHQLDVPIRRAHGPEDYYQENKIFEYAERVNRHLERPNPSFRRYPTVMPSFDNTPRFRDGGATIYRGATPELYEGWLGGALDKVSSNPPEQQIVFVNAWNEWAEGNHLEPDIEHGHAYLDATERASRSAGVEIGARSPASSKDGTSVGAFNLEERYGHLLDKYTNLQRRLTQQLRLEEASVLPFRLREHYEKAERRLQGLQKRRSKLRQLIKERRKRSKQTRERLKKTRERLANLEAQYERDVGALTRWIERMEASVFALLASRRWKIGSALGEARRRVLRKPPVPTAEDKIRDVFGEFRAWRRKGRGRAKLRGHGARRKEAPMEPAARPRPAPEASSTAADPATDGSSAGGVKAENVIWILGAPRTGSTWLGRMMRQLDGVEVWQEPFLGVMLSFRDNIANSGYAQRETFLFGEPNKPIWLKHIRQLFLAVGAERFGRPKRLVIKEPNGSVGSGLILEAFPESGAIFLVRDPRDVVASLLDLAKPGSWYGYDRFEMSAARADFDVQTGSFASVPTPTTEDERVRGLALDVATSFQAAKEAFDAHGGPKTLVRYEDLRADALGGMKKICSDLGLRVFEKQLARTVEKTSWERLPAERKGAGKHHRKATPGGWREDLTPEQARIVEEAAASVIEEFYAE